MLNAQSSRSVLFIAVATIGLLAGPSITRADSISFTGIGKSGYGSFAGSLTVESYSDTLARITVGLTNTTDPVSRGGFITGFAFNDPNSAAGGDITGVVENPPGYSTTIPTFTAIGAPEFENSIVVDDGVDAMPFGVFDLGAAIGGDWSGGGNPNSGIAIGDSDLFTFDVTGTNLSNLTARSIFDTLSEPKSSGNGGFTPASFVVRFRGGDDPNGWSDKGVAVEDDNPPPPNPVPAPAGLILAGIAGVCGLGYRRRNAG